MDQRIINLYDEYTHRPLSRKTFIKRLIQLTGSTATAMSVLPMLESNYVRDVFTTATTFLPNTSRILA